MDGLVGAAAGTPTVPGLTVLDPIPADATIVAVRAVRDADSAPVWLHLATGDLDAPTRRRLRTEIPVLIAALADLHGAPVLPVLAEGEAGGASYLVTPRPGPTLAEELVAGALPVAAVRGAVRDVADALEALHWRGLLHRGVVPSAVHRLSDDTWSLDPPLPAAMAELVAEAGADYPYQPPEVLAGGEWTTAGEVYALAATMWAALSGRSPYGTDDRLSALVGMEPRPISRLDVPAALINSLRAGLAHGAGDRPALSAFVGERLETMPPTRPVPEPAGRPLGSRYLLDELIGRGATGHVWRGHTRDGGGQVAVKLLRSELAEDPDVVMRFMRERATLTRLTHPHLVAVHDLVAEGDALAIIMDLIDGVDLRQLASEGPMDPRTAADLLAQTAAALAAVHAAGVVHRDMKPENVLVETREGRPYALLTDFGLARAADSPTLTRLTQLVGTPAYLAPELVAGREPGPPVDVYALGVTAYELFAGRRPFPESSTAVLLRAHLDQAPPRPEGLTEPVWQLLAACLGKEPAHRPTAGQLAEAWQRVAGDGRAPFDFSTESFAEPAAEPYGAPAVEPFAAPAAEPYGAPAVEPFAAPPTAGPYAGPHASPAADPYAGPPVAPFGGPLPRPARDGALETIGARRALLPAHAEDTSQSGRRARWPWYALAAVVIIGGGFAAGILLAPSKTKHQTPTTSKPPVAAGYPIQATIKQTPGGVPILSWNEDPKLFAAGSYVVVVQAGGTYQVVTPPAHTMLVTDAPAGKQICFTVNGVNLTSPPQPPPVVKPACIIPKG
ncbi:MAG: hypothetical protein DLM57_17135 [Pseudonocardiales bacterium]|nr:MAG: hypothetical protein DLM57_17135 [Pseudonocardiales bacterium]